MKLTFRIFTLSLIIGIAAIIGFGFDVGHTASTTADSITADSHERGSPATAQPLYSNLEIRIFDGITTTETAAQATSVAALYFTNTANHSVTRNDGLIGAMENHILIANESYRYVNYTRQDSSPTPTGMPATGVSGFIFSNAVFVTVKEVERPASSFL